MQPSRPHCLYSRPNALHVWQRLCLCLCASIITLSLLIGLVSVETAYARHAPTRRDRRPDREKRIRYPRANSATDNSQNYDSIATMGQPPSSD